VQEETTSKNSTVGLYRHRETGAFIGAIDDTQANAFKQWGYDLVEAGRDAAALSEEEIQAKYGKDAAPVVTPTDTKKGK
jgi:hypothetical protein